MILLYPFLALSSEYRTYSHLKELMLQKIHNYFLFSDVTKMQINHMYNIDYYFI